MYQRPAQGLYHPENEHDACGVGLVAQIDGKKSHDMLKDHFRCLKEWNTVGLKALIAKLVMAQV